MQCWQLTLAVQRTEQKPVPTPRHFIMKWEMSPKNKRVQWPAPRPHTGTSDMHIRIPKLSGFLSLRAKEEVHFVAQLSLAELDLERCRAWHPVHPGGYAGHPGTPVPGSSISLCPSLLTVESCERRARGFSWEILVWGSRSGQLEALRVTH